MNQFSIFKTKKILILSLVVIFVSLVVVFAVQAADEERVIGTRDNKKVKSWCDLNDEGKWDCTCQDINEVKDGELGRFITDPICAFCGDCTLNNFLGIGVNISKIILKYLGIFALLMFTIGGVVWISSGGSTEKVQLGKKIITGAVVGMVIVLSSVLIVRVIGNMIGVEQEYLSLEIVDTDDGPGSADLKDWKVCQEPKQNNNRTWWCYGCGLTQVNPPQGCKDDESYLVGDYVMALERLGYHDCWGESENIFDNFTQACTQDFQKDYNNGRWNYGNPPPNLLREDGKVDGDTYIAVNYIDEFLIQGGDFNPPGISWPDCAIPPISPSNKWAYNVNTAIGCKDADNSTVVKDYEIALNGLGFNCGEEDGRFDENTKDCTRAFQTHIDSLEPFYLLTGADFAPAISGEVDSATYTAMYDYYYSMLTYIDDYADMLNSYGCDCEDAIGFDPNFGAPFDVSKLTQCTKTFQNTFNHLLDAWAKVPGNNLADYGGWISRDDGVITTDTLEVYQTLANYDANNPNLLSLVQSDYPWLYEFMRNMPESDYCTYEGSLLPDWPQCPNSSVILPNDENVLLYYPWCYDFECTVSWGFIYGQPEQGCQSTQVADYKSKLHNWGFYCGEADEKFVLNTQICTQNFQNTIKDLEAFYLHETDLSSPISFSQGEVDYETFLAYDHRFQNMRDYLEEYISNLNAFQCGCPSPAYAGPETSTFIAECTQRFQKMITDLDSVWPYSVEYAPLSETGQIDNLTLQMNDVAQEAIGIMSSSFNQKSYNLMYALYSDGSTNEYTDLGCPFFDNWGDWPEGQWGPDCPDPALFLNTRAWCYGCLTKKDNQQVSQPVGCQSPAVANYQTVLNNSYFDCDCGPADGKFGSGTKDCTIRFQKAFNSLHSHFSGDAPLSLRTDGVVDLDTYSVYENFNTYALSTLDEQLSQHSFCYFGL